MLQEQRHLCQTKMLTERASGVNPFELSFVRRIHSVAQRMILTRAHEAAKPDTLPAARLSEAQCSDTHEYNDARSAAVVHE